MAKADLQIGQAKQFAGALSEQLGQLDSANLCSIMENKQAREGGGGEKMRKKQQKLQNVEELIGLIDIAIELAERIEQQLDEYDTLLSVKQRFLTFFEKFNYYF